jgi:TRAP-type mannitol/chloroaromatic compound transport system permease large subunit
MASLKGVVLPLLLITAVLGSIYSGIATPTEAAAVGAFGAFVCSALHRRLTWDLLKSVAYTTIQVQGFMMWILFAAGLYGAGRFENGYPAGGVLPDRLVDHAHRHSGGLVPVGACD